MPDFLSMLSNVAGPALAGLPGASLITQAASSAVQLPFNAYVLDLADGSYLPFQFMPDDISDTKTAQYTDYPIVGRSVPIKAYNGSPSRQISLTLVFFTMPLQMMPFPDPYTIKRWMDKLRSYAYPDYTQGIKPPHQILLRIGFAYAMKCVLTSFRGTPTKTWFGPGPLLPHGQSAALTFEEIADVPLSYDEVQNGAYEGSGGSSGGSDSGGGFSGVGG